MRAQQEHFAPVLHQFLSLFLHHLAIADQPHTDQRIHLAGTMSGQFAVDVCVVA